MSKHSWSLYYIYNPLLIHKELNNLYLVDLYVGYFKIRHLQTDE